MPSSSSETLQLPDDTSNIATSPRIQGDLGMLLQLAALFNTSEEQGCQTGSVRQAVPPDLLRDCRGGAGAGAGAADAQLIGAPPCLLPVRAPRQPLVVVLSVVLFIIAYVRVIYCKYVSIWSLSPYYITYYDYD